MQLPKMFLFAVIFYALKKTSKDETETGNIKLHVNGRKQISDSKKEEAIALP